MGLVSLTPKAGQREAAGAMGLGLIVGWLFLGPLRLVVAPAVPAIGTRPDAAVMWAPAEADCVLQLIGPLTG